jgi:ubiquitin carboxyl-terminal hydrolase 25/28
MVNADRDMQRVQFNRETLQPYKSQAYVKFGETIYMDRFLDTADPQKKAHSKALQSELNDCRDRITLLTLGKVSVGVLLLCHRQSKPILSSI